MANLFDAIFNRKDDEQIKLPTPVPTPIQPVQTKPVYDPSKWQPTNIPLEATKNIVTAIPGAVFDVAHNILTGTLRSAVSAAKTLGGLQSDAVPTQPKGKVGEFLLGKEPIYGVGKGTELAAKKLQSGEYGFKLPSIASYPLATVGVVGGTLLDVAPVPLPKGSGKGGKVVLETADDLVSAAAKTFQKKAGEGIVKKLPELIDDLAKGGYKIAEPLLKQLDEKVLQGENSVIQKTGDALEFIFDEGFIPKNLEVKPNVPKLKVEKPVVEPQPKLKVQQQVDEGDIPIDKEKLSEFDKEMREANKSLKEEYGLKKRSPILVEQETGAEILEKDLGKAGSIQRKNYQAGNLGLTERYNLRKESPVLTDPDSGATILEGELRRQNKAAYPQFREIERQLSELDDIYGSIPVSDKQIDVLGFDEINGWNQNIMKMGDVKTLNASWSNPLRVLEDKGLTKGSDEVISFLKEKIYYPLEQANTNFGTDITQYVNNAVREVGEKLGIKGGTKESKAIMEIGEGRRMVGKEYKPYTLEDLQKEFPTTWQNIVQAKDYVRGMFDDLFKRVNEVRTQYGYDPIPYLQNYFTHMQDMSTKWLPTVRNLPTIMSTINTTTKPGVRFWGSALKRKGGMEYTDDALFALKNYLESALYQIHFTPVIQRQRQIVKTIVNQAANNPNLEETHLTNFAKWLTAHTSLLAGKNESDIYRIIESKIGRGTADTMKWLVGNVGKNLVSTFTVALSNLGANVQTLAETGEKNFARGILETIFSPDLKEKNMFKVDGIQSGFLTGRFKADTGKLYRSTTEAIWDAFSYPARSFDEFTSTVAIRSKYNQLVESGMKPSEAMRYADEWAARAIGDRRIGMTPTAMSELSPLTMFQLEPINYIQMLVHDTPKQYRGEALKGAMFLARLFGYTYLFNNLYQATTGRRLMLDPIDYAIEMTKEVTSDDKLQQKVGKMAQVTLENIPVIGRGSLPIMAAIPTVNTITEDPRKALVQIGMAFNPAGGLAQLNKTWEGAERFIEGYKQDTKGNVKYPIEQNVINLARLLLSGEYAAPEAREYYEKEYKPLGAGESMNYKWIQKEKGQDEAIAYYEILRKENELKAQVNKIAQAKRELEAVLGDPYKSDEEKKNKLAEFRMLVGATTSEINDTLAAYVNENNINILSQINNAIVSDAFSGTDYLRDLAKSVPQGTLKVKKGSVPKLKTTKAATIKLKTTARKAGKEFEVGSITPPRIRTTYTTRRYTPNIRVPMPRVSGLRVS